eukprot:Pompholyxophrys_punicea_v1_NODE_482_length_1859_cov_25.114191.p1 type:complete len:199 gc:universal NODE_482_length_1859_cov_25.114191:148-744(+)
MALDSIDISKIGCFGSDGAGVVFGHKTGVGVRLNSLNPMMLAMHCICHREALACKGAADEVSYFALTFFPITEQLGRYYSDSATRTSTLQAEQRLAGVESRKVICSAFTRWLSHDKVTEVIHSRFIPILKDLNQNSASDATSLGLFVTMCSRDYIASLLLQRDNLPRLSRLRKVFQNQNADYSVLEIEVPILLQQIKE